MEYGSREVAKVAISLALTNSLEDEKRLQKKYNERGFLAAAVNFGGDFVSSMPKILERSVVCAKREGIIQGSHAEEGAILGATREAVAQIGMKAVGFNVGGKVGVARFEEHVAVAVYFGIGILHLNEVAIGLGHRII